MRDSLPQSDNARWPPSGAALALYVLVAGGARAPVATGPPLDDIGSASRARLEQVIRDAELREEPAR